MPLVLPTQTMPGVTGYITIVIPATPNGKMQWAQLTGTNPSVAVWVQPSVGTLEPVASGPASGGSQDLNWLNAGGSANFLLIPMDASSNPYAAVETLKVQGKPGIFASPSTPSARLAELKAANPGLPVYGNNPDIGGTGPAAVGFSLGDWIGNNPVLAGGIGLGLVLVVSRLK